ncbi:hypothetical protein FKM82_018814 [Ascaphus truei]
MISTKMHRRQRNIGTHTSSGSYAIVPALTPNDLKGSDNPHWHLMKVSDRVDLGSSTGGPWLPKQLL